MRVDFYVHPGDNIERMHFTACRLAEKAYLLQHRIFVRVSTPAQAGVLDEQMWTFRDGSFLPHGIAEQVSAEERSRFPVLIGIGEPPDSHRDLLINLASEPVANPEQSQRIAELVDAEQGRRDAGRERYRQYRDAGCELQTHKL